MTSKVNVTYSSVSDGAVSQLNSFTVNTSDTGLGGGCFLTSSSDGNGDLISPETELLVAKVKSAIIIPFFFFIGAPCQFVNIVVFFKQGLRDRVNLCLFSLAIVDLAALCSSFLLFSEHMFMFRSHETIGPVYAFFVNNKLLLFYSCTYGSALIHMTVALDRCLCVFFPFRSKTLLKTRNVAIFIVIAVPLVCFLKLIVHAKYIVVCYFDTRRHVTYLGLYITAFEARNKVLLDIIDVVFYGIVIAMICPIIISIATFVTSIKLWNILAWRKETSSADIKKELAGTKMLILLSVEFLAFSAPVVFIKIFPSINPEFSVKGRYRLFFLAITNIAEMCFSVRLSFSSVVYYIASSRYRRTLFGLFQIPCSCHNISKERENTKSQQPQRQKTRITQTESSSIILS